MRALRCDLWGFLPRRFLAGLAILLAAAVLSLVLFPAGHGSFVSTHGPATAFRSRRFLLLICSVFAMLIAAACGMGSRLKPWRRRVDLLRREIASRVRAHTPLSAVLLC
ncbi:MAG TPA: hypothetical protein VKT29_00650 [Terriglobales bacterium]|nr:hypothetical protein [Terriglobales bacterium]